MGKKSSRKIDSFSVCFLLQYIFFQIWNSSNQGLYCGDIDVLTRVQPNIAKQIYNIVYFSYYFFSYLNIYDYFFCYFYQFKHISLKASENGKQLTSDRGATVTELSISTNIWFPVIFQLPAKGDQQTNPLKVMTYHCHMMVLIMETLFLL
jgi:hypothetical protein